MGLLRGVSYRTKAHEEMTASHKARHNLGMCGRRMMIKTRKGGACERSREIGERDSVGMVKLQIRHDI